MTIKNVEVSIIDQAWDAGLVKPQEPERLTGKTVAVIGSGPAGLAAAQQLTRAGHTVAVYERADRIGGLLRYGIPEFKMEKRHLNRRIEQMRAEGTKFRTGVAVGQDILASQICATATTPSSSPSAPPRPATCRSPAANSTASTRRWSTCRCPTRSVEGDFVTPPITRQGQARHRHRRRRHRRGLPRHRHPAGRGLGHPAGDPAAAARGAPGRPALADLPDDLPGHLARTRRRRRAGLRASAPPSSSATSTGASGPCG